MIQIEKKPKAPKDFSSYKTDKISIKLSNGIIITQKDYKDYNEKKVKKILLKHQNFKCCFCECKLDISTCNIYLFRPVGFLCDDPGKQNIEPPYWWLAYDWNNYFVSCDHCKAKKQDQFPLLPDGIRAETPDDKLSNENPFLIHPIDEDPEKFIAFDWKSVGFLVKAFGTDEDGRGNKTIKELTAINRMELLEKRSDLLKEMIKNIQLLSKAKESGKKEFVVECIWSIIKYTEKDREFLGLARAIYRDFNLEHELELYRALINHIDPTNIKETKGLLSQFSKYVEIKPKLGPVEIKVSEMIKDFLHYISKQNRNK
jgi:uncharacterized protein (TIGR02646 family)